MNERMSAAEYNAAMGQPSAAKTKYKAEPITVDGIRFDSKKEARRWAELKLLEKAGDITDLRRQAVVYLDGKMGPLLTRTGRKMRITVDFAYVDLNTGLTVYEDAKGMPTRDYEVRRAVAAAQGVEVKEV